MRIIIATILGLLNSFQLKAQASDSILLHVNNIKSIVRTPEDLDSWEIVMQNNSSSCILIPRHLRMENVITKPTESLGYEIVDITDSLHPISIECPHNTSWWPTEEEYDTICAKQEFNRFYYTGDVGCLMQKGKYLYRIVFRLSKWNKDLWDVYSPWYVIRVER